MQKTVAKLLFISLVLTSGSRAAPAPRKNDILIIANRAVQQTDFSLADLQSIFLKRKLLWNNGAKVVPVNALDGSRLRDDFRKRIIGMSASEESLYWQTAQIRQGIAAPASFSNVIKAVFKLKGSIGYVYRSEYTAGVVNVIKVLPGRD